MNSTESMAHIDSRRRLSLGVYIRRYSLYLQCSTLPLVIAHFRSWLRAYGTVCRLASLRRRHWLSSGGVSNQSFSCDVLVRTWRLCSALLVLCIMLDSERVLFIVKCSCSSRIYDTLIIFVHNNNNNNNIGDRTGRRDLKTHHDHHWQYKRDSVSVSAAVRGTSKETRFFFQSTSLPASPLQSVMLSSTQCLCACLAVCLVGIKIIIIIITLWQRSLVMTHSLMQTICAKDFM